MNLHALRTCSGTSLLILVAGCLALVETASPARASSHREAPLIAQDSSADATDVYAFVNADQNQLVVTLPFRPLSSPTSGLRDDAFFFDLNGFETATPGAPMNLVPPTTGYSQGRVGDAISFLDELMLPIVKHSQNFGDPSRASLLQISRLSSPVVNEVVLPFDRQIFEFAAIRDGNAVRSFVTYAEDSVTPRFQTVVTDRNGNSTAPVDALDPGTFNFFFPEQFQFGSDGQNIVGMGTSFLRGIFRYRFDPTEGILIPDLIAQPNNQTASSPRVAVNTRLQLGAAVISDNAFPFGNSPRVFDLSVDPTLTGFPNGRRFGDDVLDIGLDALSIGGRSSSFSSSQLNAIPNDSEPSPSTPVDVPYAAATYSRLADGKTYVQLLNAEGIPVTAPFAVLDASEAFRSPTRNLFATVIDSRDAILFGGVQGVSDSSAPLGFRDVAFMREYHLFENAAGTSLNDRRIGEENDVPFGIRDRDLLLSGALMYANPLGNGDLGQDDLDFLGLQVAGGTATLVNDPNLSGGLANQVVQLDFTGDAAISTDPLSMGDRADQVISIDFDFLVDQAFVDQGASIAASLVFDDGDGVKESDGSDIAIAFVLPAAGQTAGEWFSFADAYRASQGVNPDAAVPAGLSQESWFLQLEFGATDDPTVYLDNLLVAGRGVIPEPATLWLALLALGTAIGRRTFQ